MTERPEIIVLRGAATPDNVALAKAFLAEAERVWATVVVDQGDKSAAGREAQRLADAPMGARLKRGRVPA